MALVVASVVQEVVSRLVEAGTSQPHDHHHNRQDAPLTNFDELLTPLSVRSFTRNVEKS